MTFIVRKIEDGTAWLAGGEAPTATSPGFDYERLLSPDEVVDGKKVSELPVGITVVKRVPLEP